MTINKLFQKHSQYAKRYKRAQDALVQLDPSGLWMVNLQEPHDDNIKVPM